VPRVDFEKLTAAPDEESSEKIRCRVIEAQLRQIKRFKNSRIHNNSEMGNREILKHCKLDEPSLGLVRSAVNQMHLSARGYSRILKVARTIADLAQEEHILLTHIAEALQFRAPTEF